VNPNEPLAVNLAATKSGDRSRHLFDAAWYVFGVTQLSIAKPPGQSGDGLFEPGARSRR
jgi:hypothetical protein